MTTSSCRLTVSPLWLYSGKAGIFVIRPYPLVGRPAPTSIIRSVWRQHVISALLVSPAVNIWTTAMSANSLYAEIFKILSGGPIFSLPRLLLLLCVQFWFAFKVVGDLRSEIAHWQFLDSWSEHLPWMDERHLVVNVTSDASQYAWGGIVHNLSGPPLETRGIWREDVRDKPIAVK